MSTKRKQINRKNVSVKWRLVKNKSLRVFLREMLKVEKIIFILAPLKDHLK
jgi:hypothetical protein